MKLTFHKKIKDKKSLGQRELITEHIYCTLGVICNQRKFMVNVVNHIIKNNKTQVNIFRSTYACVCRFSFDTDRFIGLVFDLCRPRMLLYNNFNFISNCSKIKTGCELDRGIS